MKMTKAVWFVTILAVCLAFVGCSNNGTNSNTNGSSNPQISSGVSSGDNNQSSEMSGGQSGGMDAFTVQGAIDDVYQSIMNGADNWLAEMDADTMTNNYDMDFSAVDEVYGRVPQANTAATSIIGVKAKEGRLEDAKKELMKYQAAMEGSFEKYLPDQYQMTKDYRIIEKGDYVFLVIAENADDIEDALHKAMDKI